MYGSYRHAAAGQAPSRNPGRRRCFGIGSRARYRGDAGSPEPEPRHPPRRRQENDRESLSRAEQSELQCRCPRRNRRCTVGYRTRQFCRLGECRHAQGCASPDPRPTAPRRRAQPQLRAAVVPAGAAQRQVSPRDPERWTGHAHSAGERSSVRAVRCRCAVAGASARVALCRCTTEPGAELLSQGDPFRSLALFPAQGLPRPVARLDADGDRRSGDLRPPILGTAGSARLWQIRFGAASCGSSTPT